MIIRSAMARAIVLIAAIASVPVAVAQDDCFARCDSNYYLCLRGGASVGERACSTSRSSCSMSCTLARKSHGAIAYSKSTAAWGAAYHHGSQELAERRARQECTQARPDASDCEVLVWFNNRCAALALGDNRAYGAAQDSNRQVASEKAMAYCRPHGHATCKIVREVCSLN
jgi:hypothetical protein